MPIFYRNSRSMHFLDEGTGEAILLLHGLGSSSRDWEAQIAALSDRFRVIAPDHRGHGFSNPSPGPYQMKDLAQDCRALMDNLGIDSYHLVGFSMGGMIAFELAVLNTDCIKSLTIINSGPHVAGHSWRTLLLILFRSCTIRIVGMRKLGTMIGKKLFPLPSQKPLLESFENQMAMMSKKSYQHALNAIANFSVIDHLSQLSMPALVISSDQDYTSVEAKKDYIQKMPNAELSVIKDSRHACPIDQPEQLNSVINNFLHTLEKNHHRSSTAPVLETINNSNN